MNLHFKQTKIRISSIGEECDGQTVLIADAR